MIDAGADMVVGGHPHVTQEVEYYNGKLIVYSIGNFIFNGFDPGPSRIGWVLRTRLNKQGLVAWDTLVGKIDEQGQPHLQSDATSPAGTNAAEPIVEVKGLTESPFVKSQSQTQ